YPSAWFETRSHALALLTMRSFLLLRELRARLFRRTNTTARVAVRAAAPSAEMRRHEIDERTHLGREVARLRIDQPDGIGLGAEFLEHIVHLPRGNGVAHVIVVNLRQPVAGAHRLA